MSEHSGVPVFPLYTEYTEVGVLPVVGEVDMDMFIFTPTNRKHNNRQHVTTFGVKADLVDKPGRTEERLSKQTTTPVVYLPT